MKAETNLRLPIFDEFTESSKSASMPQINIEIENDGIIVEDDSDMNDSSHDGNAD